MKAHPMLKGVALQMLLTDQAEIEFRRQQNALLPDDNEKEEMIHKELMRRKIKPNIEKPLS
jgi:hypothetical protein